MILQKTGVSFRDLSTSRVGGRRGRGGEEVAVARAENLFVRFSSSHSYSFRHFLGVGGCLGTQAQDKDMQINKEGRQSLGCKLCGQ